MLRFVTIYKATGTKQSNNSICMYISSKFREEVPDRLVFNHRELFLQEGSSLDMKGSRLHKNCDTFIFKVPEDMIDNLLGTYDIEQENEIYYLNKRQ